MIDADVRRESWVSNPPWKLPYRFVLRQRRPPGTGKYSMVINDFAGRVIFL